jgi:hypothetical protein
MRSPVILASVTVKVVDAQVVRQDEQDISRCDSQRFVAPRAERAKGETDEGNSFGKLCLGV